MQKQKGRNGSTDGLRGTGRKGQRAGGGGGKNNTLSRGLTGSYILFLTFDILGG